MNKKLYLNSKIFKKNILKLKLINSISRQKIIFKYI